MTRFLRLLLVAAAVVSSGCSQARESSEPLNELAKTRVRDVDVVLLSSDTTVNTGKDTFTVEFRATSDGRLVDVGEVKANATMPMTGMAPMFGPVDVEPTSVTGRYLATSELSMAGEWRVSLEWNRPAGQGSVTFSPMVN
jgi:hypothetical protein